MKQVLLILMLIILNIIIDDPGTIIRFRLKAWHTKL